MLKKRLRKVLSSSQEQGWVMEPESKQILKDIGISVPKFRVVTEWEEALGAAGDIGYPLVCKVVSSSIIHKSDKGGVIVGVDSQKKLKSAFQKLKQLDGFKSMLVEETVDGLELIVGAKNDYQFGPVILLGIGGIGVEIYQDTSIRMAPISDSDVDCMISDLKAHQLIEGFRGQAPVNREKLVRMMIGISELSMELGEQFESIDLNPVMCTDNYCIAADARIILKSSDSDI
ncbi:MAG TPA: acetate--CoA ligase family protein [Deltaproteobacteria bacterium]|nr:acetate--CoA ligase family protein [Deltaproteobacteria bacterium]